MRDAVTPPGLDTQAAEPPLSAKRCWSGGVKSHAIVSHKSDSLARFDPLPALKKER
ncbi:hypothetical protein EAM_1478 [Erwinia amylovora ATCC 49946]|nr:hypothetical protein EAM01S_02_01570 [Erwinia amylovora NBRC 12687 = CFBP 1232]CBJ46153.1 hypothetical protein EAM_1478 [Erwinia amylovora ATCC 49946]